MKTVWSTVPTLGNFELPTIELLCTECDRRGRYNLERARAQHGDEMTLNQFMRLVANCPRDGDERRPCRIGCPDLAYMFTGAPFSDKSYK